jgi:hypothetical protein
MPKAPDSGLAVGLVYWEFGLAIGLADWESGLAVDLAHWESGLAVDLADWESGNWSDMMLLQPGHPGNPIQPGNTCRVPTGIKGGSPTMFLTIRAHEHYIAVRQEHQGKRQRISSRSGCMSQPQPVHPAVAVRSSFCRYRR